MFGKMKCARISIVWRRRHREARKRGKAKKGKKPKTKIAANTARERDWDSGTKKGASHSVSLQNSFHILYFPPFCNVYSGYTGCLFVDTHKHARTHSQTQSHSHLALVHGSLLSMRLAFFIDRILCMCVFVCTNVPFFSAIYQFSPPFATTTIFIAAVRFSHNAVCVCLVRGIHLLYIHTQRVYVLSYLSEQFQ